MNNLQCIVSADPASYKNLGVSKFTFAGDNKFEIEAATLVLSNVTQSDPWLALWPTFQFFDEFITKNDPDLVIIEKTSSFSGSFITGQISNISGVLLAVCGKHECDVQFVYPTHVKKVITGKGKATKIQMKRSVSELIEKYTGQKMKFDSEHAYDACGNIFCWLIDNGLLGDANV